MASFETDSVAPEVLFPLAPITVVVGHYGVGKTNFSLNLAIDAVRRGEKVTLVDLDLVNPYFRSSDYTELLEACGVDVVSPVLAGTTLDGPSISGRIYTVIESALDVRGGIQGSCPGSADLGGRAEKPCSTELKGQSNTSSVIEVAKPNEVSHVIIDAGGDDVGARALGRFAPMIEKSGYRMLYVINHYRNLTQTPEEAAQLLGEIEAKCKLKASGIVNNSHLKQETTEAVLVDSLPFAQSTAQLLELPLVCTAVPKEIVDQKSTLFSKSDGLQNVYPVQVYVRTPWDS